MTCCGTCCKGLNKVASGVSYTLHAVFLIIGVLLMVAAGLVSFKAIPQLQLFDPRENPEDRWIVGGVAATGALFFIVSLLGVCALRTADRTRKYLIPYVLFFVVLAAGAAALAYAAFSKGRAIHQLDAAGVDVPTVGELREAGVEKFYEGFTSKFNEAACDVTMRGPTAEIVAAVPVEYECLTEGQEDFSKVLDLCVSFLEDERTLNGPYTRCEARVITTLEVVDEATVDSDAAFCQCSAALVSVLKPLMQHLRNGLFAGCAAVIITSIFLISTVCVKRRIGRKEAAAKRLTATAVPEC